MIEKKSADEIIRDNSIGSFVSKTGVVKIADK